MAANNLILDAIATVQEADVIGSADKGRLLASISRYWDERCGGRTDCYRCPSKDTCLKTIDDMLGS